MRYIAKRNPKQVCLAWYQYAKNPSAKFKSRQAGVAAARWELRRALAHEQGYLCAFCMSPLNCNIDINGLAKPHNDGMTKIAHLTSQKPVKPPKPSRNVTIPTPTQLQRDRLSVNYKNVVLACQGKGAYKFTHCDTHQEADDVTIQLTHRGAMRNIRFLGNGIIETDDPVIQRQIGQPTSGDDPNSLLNLNNPALCGFRADAWKAVSDDVDNSLLSPRTLLSRWRAEASQSVPKLKDYYEIGIYYLELKLGMR